MIRMSMKARHHGAAFSVAGLAAIAAALAWATLSVAGPAMAHNYYISSTPGINEVLTKLPDQFVVTTNDNLLDLNGARGGFFMKVTGPDGLFYGDGCVTVSGASVSMPAALGPAGSYILEWQVVSADGHTVSDTIPFAWKPTPNAESTTKGASTVPNCGEKSLSSPDGSSAVTAAKDANTDVLWIGGAVVAVALAIVATLLLLRPRKKNEETTE